MKIEPCFCQALKRQRLKQVQPGSNLKKQKRQQTWKRHRKLGMRSCCDRPSACYAHTRQAKPLQRCTLSGPVLRDTARLSQRYLPIARYGVFGASTWRIGCDTPSPSSERFPKWRCDTPPSKGVSQRCLRDTL